MPSLRSPSIAARHAARSASVMPQTSSAREAMRAQRRRHRGERLRPRRLLERNRARRHGALLDREDRPAGSRVRARRASRSCSPGARPARARRLAQGDERRRRRVVVVPEIVVHGLERPHHLPGRRVQRDDRVARSGCRRGAARRSSRAPRCRWARTRGRASGSADEHRPRVGGAGLVRHRAAPFAVRGIRRILRDRIPAPLQRAGPRVERAHLAAGRDQAGCCRRSTSP